MAIYYSRIRTVRWGTGENIFSHRVDDRRQTQMNTDGEKDFYANFANLREFS